MVGHTMTLPRLSIPPFNAKELHALVAIAHFGSLVGAAAFLQTSQSALSRMVTRIEKLVGVRLFVRSTRRIELTPAGREFVAVSERVLSDLQIAVNGLGEVAKEQRGQVIVSSLPIVVYRTLPSLVRAFRERRPNVAIQLRAGYSSAIVEDVTGGLADFGIISGELAPANIERIDLRRESLYVVFPADHPLAEPNVPIRLSQLRDVPLVSPPRDSHTRLLVEGAAAAVRMTLRHAVVVPGFPEMVEYVRAGVGPGIVPAGTLPEPLQGDLRARLLSSPALAIPVSMIRLVGRHLSPAAESFWSLVLQHLHSQPRWSPAPVASISGARSRKVKGRSDARESPARRARG
jgi:DNA-binding transcriptional LysR family regulator